VRLANATIVGHGIAVPDGRLTNQDLEARVDTSDAWIVERTGIRERRIAGPDESTATLAVTAAAAAIKSAGLIPTEIDLMIVATASPEQPLPHTGAFVGDRLGLRCGSFDLAAACAGFVYELVVGASMLAIGTRNVLLVGAETVSRLMDPTDRSTSILFGDGAGAAVIVPAEGEEGLIAWDLGCDGSAAHLLEITAGGSRLPASVETLQARQHYMTMAGQEVFRRAVRAVVDSAIVTLERAELTAADIDWFVPHQANIRIIESAAKKLDIPMERTVVNIERYGNTSSASIPLALFEAVDDGRVQPGDVVLLSGFGAGMTWASAILRWGPS
jgi:3-oxoacyl-[acyl-carrier-protein] synthase III